MRAASSTSSLPLWRRLGLSAEVAAFAVLYPLLVLLGEWLSNSFSDFSTFWPANGLYLATLLVIPRRSWPAVVAIGLTASVGSSIAVGRAPLLILPFALVDAAKPLLASWLLQLRDRRTPDMHEVRDVVALLLLGSGLACGVGGLLGALATVAQYAYASLWMEAANLWAGDALGVLVVAPAVLSWIRPAQRPPARGWRRGLEAGALAAALVAVAFAVFGAVPVPGLGTTPGPESVHIERGYLLLPVLGWAALRFGPRGASAANVAVSLLAALSTMRAPSDLAGAPLRASLNVQIQAFTAVAAVVALVLAAAWAERRRAEAALKESEAQFAAFLEHSPAALFIRNEAGRTLARSRSLEKLLATSDSELDPPTDPSLTRGGPEVSRAEDAHVLATGEPVQVDSQLGDRTFLTQKFRIPRDGLPPLVGGVGVEVTEQRRAERALRLSQAALDRGFGAVLIVDPDGQVAYANAAASELFGQGRRRLAGQSLWDLDPRFLRSGWRRHWRDLQERQTVLVEGELRRPGGDRVEVEVVFSFFAFDGRAYGIYAAHDVTDRRRAEVAQRLASVGTLAAGMAHEINNPLSYVHANVGFAAETLEPLRGQPPVDGALEALRDALDGAARVAKVVRDLKAVSRIQPEERKVVDLHGEIERAAKLAHNEIRHRARLVTDYGAVPEVEAAEFELGQVVLNLLTNAAHAIPEGAADRNAIRITTRTSPAGAAVVEVRDTGAGIPPAIRSRIFEPFFTTKPVGKGTGLGLSLCHGIVTALGGAIEVESEEGKGTCFRITLPPCRARPAPEPARATQPAPGRRARVLVVDDEPLVGVSIRRILSGHAVEALTDPREALRRLAEGEAFDVVLCDLMIPEMTGMELHAALLERAPEVARRMVFMTGGAFTETARAFLEQVDSPQLPKPFEAEALRKLVASYVGPGA